MSQYGKMSNSLGPANRVKDGWFLNPNRKYHSFYTEFTNEEIDEMFKKIKYERIRSPSERGSDQFRAYKILFNNLISKVLLLYNQWTVNHSTTEVHYVYVDDT